MFKEATLKVLQMTIILFPILASCSNRNLFLKDKGAMLSIINSESSLEDSISRLDDEDYDLFQLEFNALIRDGINDFIDYQEALFKYRHPFRIKYLESIRPSSFTLFSGPRFYFGYNFLHVACRYLDKKMFEYFYLKTPSLIFDNYVLTPTMSPFQLMLFVNNDEEAIISFLKNIGPLLTNDLVNRTGLIHFSCSNSKFKILKFLLEDRGYSYNYIFEMITPSIDYFKKESIFRINKAPIIIKEISIIDSLNVNLLASTFCKEVVDLISDRYSESKATIFTKMTKDAIDRYIYDNFWLTFIGGRAKHFIKAFDTLFSSGIPLSLIFHFQNFNNHLVVIENNIDILYDEGVFDRILSLNNNLSFDELQQIAGIYCYKYKRADKNVVKLFKKMLHHQFVKEMERQDRLMNDIIKREEKKRKRRLKRQIRVYDDSVSYRTTYRKREKKKDIPIPKKEESYEDKFIKYGFIGDCKSMLEIIDNIDRSTTFDHFKDESIRLLLIRNNFTVTKELFLSAIKLDQIKVIKAIFSKLSDLPFEIEYDNISFKSSSQMIDVLKERSIEENFEKYNLRGGEDKASEYQEIDSEELHQIFINNNAYDSMLKLDMNTLKRVERVLQDLSKGRSTDTKSIKSLSNVSEIRLLGSSGTSNARIYFTKRDNIIFILEVTYKSDMKISENLLKTINNRLKEQLNNFIELKLD